MNSFGFILTEDERYIILFGGECMDIDLDTIWIWNLESMQFTESKIRCPVIGGFRVQMVSNLKRNVHLVSGFVRLECCSGSSTRDIFCTNDKVKSRGKSIDEGVCNINLPKDVLSVITEHFMCIDIYVLH